MNRNLDLSLKIIKSFGLLSGIRIIVAHLFKTKSVTVFIRELNRTIVMRPWTGDFATVRQVIWDKEYDFDLAGVKTVIDLGANIGISTILLSRKFPDAKVIALEPEKRNFNLLRQNTEGIENITILNSAVWHEDGFVNLVNEDVKSNEFRVTGSSAVLDKNVIESITVASLLKRYDLEQIDLLKVDIEGAEEDIFCKGDMNWLSKLKCCIIEIHDPAFESVILGIMNDGFSNSVKGEKILFTKAQIPSLAQ